MHRLIVRSSQGVRHLSWPVQPLRVGSAPGNDVVLDLPGVSRRHVLLVAMDGGVLAVDLGSKNGLLRAGTRQTETLLRPGESVQMGSAWLVLEEVSSAEAEMALCFPAGLEAPGERVSQGETGAAVGDPPFGSAQAALRLVRELERVPTRTAGRNLPVLLARSREALGAAAAFLFHCDQGAGLTLSVLDGPVPSDEVVSALESGLLPDGGEEILKAGENAVLVAGSGPWLAAVFDGPVPLWSRDLAAWLVARLASSPARPPHGAKAPERSGLRLPEGMVTGSSPAMSAALERVRVAAGSDLDVLLLGETGTGKELLARALHLSGLRSSGPFIALNCAAIPGELLESQLFGVSGRIATGVDPHPGLVVQADGGTLLLDEVGELPERLQAKLLRVLQEREVLPLGGTVPRKVRLRVIAASNRDLPRLVKEGSFRPDLYYRLRGVEIRVPPLRERREDLPALVFSLAARAAERVGKTLRGVSRRALARIESHDWPGNVRELERTIELAVLLCPDGGTIESRYLSFLEEAAVPNPGEPRPLQQRLDEVEAEAIREALTRAGGNKAEAARRLGITRNGLNLKIRRLGI
ncbi:MAG TPA: sigma 54-interacting transcriptional regulator [Thermoanaerobaculia bacterium]|nr:sigma 54-interacting transcriptional regulator [Thermoanaerobaculia bacterium]